MKHTFAVIFDMDGVIVDSNPVHRDSIRVFCREYGVRVSDEFLKRGVYGRTNSEWIPELFPEATDSDVKQLSDEKEAIFRQMFEPNQHVVKGLVNLIEELHREEIPIGVATSAPVDNETYILKSLGIRAKFSTILHSSHVERSKPAPDIYQQAAENLNRKPEHCVVFEDSIPGSRAALKAGCYTVGVTTTYSSKELRRCHRTIRDFAGVDLTLLKRWVQKRDVREMKNAD